jgi:hypothetical protein
LARLDLANAAFVHADFLKRVRDRHVARHHPVVRRGRWAEDPEALRRSARNGVIAVAALRGLGVPGTTIAERCRDGGRWRRLLPGIVLLGSGPATPSQRVAAALVYGGPRAVLTGLEACRRHGVRRGPDPSGSVHVLVPEVRQLKPSGFVVVERTTRMPRTTIRDGVPLAFAPRACLDGARRLHSAAEITELIADTVQRGLCTPAQLATELRDGSQRGSATPRRVLADISEGVRSAAERDAKRLLASSGLPEPWWNVKVFDSHGRFLGVSDAWFDEVALTWEINSYAWHLNPQAYAREVQRTAEMTAASVMVVPVLPTAVRDDPIGSLTNLEAAYEAAARRPRPPVRAVRTC